MRVQQNRKSRGSRRIRRYRQVKDAPPAVWLANGSTYIKHVPVKDTLPAGYADNGTAWVQTTAKVATVVPA